MTNLNSLLAEKQASSLVKREIFDKPPTPLLFSRAIQENFEEELEKFLRSNQFISIEDTYSEQLEEFFYILHPHLEENLPETNELLAKFLEEQKQGQEDFDSCGTWVYYPWTNKFVHFLEPELHQKIRTTRNKFLLSEREQEEFRNCVVAIAGLSIGNSVALSLAYSGGCETMKLADPDIFSATNLNRVRVPVHYLGVKKVYVAAQQIYELNPYANLILFTDGINESNLEDFLVGSPKPSIIVDEMDDLKLKIFIRLAAKAIKLPVVMATDNGDNAIIDVDRFDLGDTSPLKDLPPMDLKTVVSGINIGEPLELKIKEKVKLATKIVGPSNAALRMQESLMKVGNEIVSWPQLGIAAFLGGAALTYVIKKLALGVPIDSGKYHLKLDQIFLSDYDSEENLKIRADKTNQLTDYINDPNLIPKANYQVWETDENDYPQNGSQDEKLKFILNYALMAPSSHNTQPWKFSIESDQINLYADFERRLEVSDPTYREFYISLGACLTNLLVALSRFGFVTQVEFPEDKMVARIKIQRNGQTEQKLGELFPSVKKRGSDRSLYLDKSIPDDLLNQLKNLEADSSSVNITIITDQTLKEKIIELVGEGSKLMMANEKFREELSSWLRHNFTNQPDGMPGSTFGMNDIQSIIGPFLIKNFDLGHDQQKNDQKTVASASALVVISSNENSPRSWVEVGRIYEELILMATQNNLNNSTLASVVELGDLNQKLMDILKISTRPQVFFRLGYSQSEVVERSPRLNVDQVLIK